MPEYQQYQKLIFKIAWKMHRKTGLDVDEFVSEFNVVFVESDQRFVKAKHISFTKYLCGNIYRRFANIMKSRNTKINSNLFYSDTPPSSACYDLLDSILIRDSFFNSKNPVILSIAEIICTNTLPATAVKVWLRKKLFNEGFKHKEIDSAFAILNEVIDPGGIC